MKIPFRKVAIFDPWLILEQTPEGIHGKDIEDKTAAWVQKVVDKGADGFYLRLRGLPPELGARVIDETLHRLPKTLQRIILPTGWEDFNPAPAAIQFPERTLMPFDFPAGMLKGCSCHSHEAVAEAVDEGFNYIFFSPVFSTLTHPERTPLGTENLRELCARTPIPVFALGGVNESNAQACLDAGAYGIAAIRMFLH